ncbi:checkpoint clamp complex protein Rad1 [Ophidiomyces ophidiicola]|nr:checkpoint clamp complex protein Rad1 [Ophidiomyces ophidiicola]KAI1988587.1 checkpoint clamp complex protein Rad1 [Ophidiomyces ophidiicola]KAI1991976.1 checkpoint clamp complex protein Rad1 [Ophidiomyces ophidiicola]KAI1992145.1 checkpoint clamp complex protein Rad1 [Ophidiomyces ophidiicola]
MDSSATPIFSAVSNFTHHLYVILRCIGFASKAAIQITPQGIRFSAEDGRVMQGLAFLDKSLFTSFSFKPDDTAIPSQISAEDDLSNTSSYPRFLVSLTALIETLQIFGLTDSAHPSNPVPNSNAFSASALHLDRTCTITYVRPGSPLCITLAEAGVTTTCELTTYEPDDPTFTSSTEDVEIPLQRDAIVFKIIMRSLWLHNAITELDSTDPTVLTLSASSKAAPYFAFSASGGPFGESAVEFSIDKESDDFADSTYKSFNDDGSSKPPKRGKLAPAVAETFLVSPPPPKSRVRQSYRFALVRKALRAMAISSKVSIRGDNQGVLSMQFMIELGENMTSREAQARATRNLETTTTGTVSFVDFRFVPLVEDEEMEEAAE